MGQRPAVGRAGRRVGSIIAGALVITGLATACGAATPMAGSPTTGPAPTSGAATTGSTATTVRSTVSSTAAATPASSSRTSSNSGWTPLLQPTADLPADHPGVVAQQAMTQVGTVRMQGTTPFAGDDLETDSVTVYHDGLVTAREVWIESGQGGLLGYLGVDGQLWDKQLGRADADRDAASWRPLDAPGVSANDRLLAAEQTRLGGRLEAVDFLLAVPDPQAVDTATVDGRSTTLYTGWAPIEAIYPGLRDSPGYSSTSVAGWQVEIWVATDDGLPVRVRAEARDGTGRPVGTDEESYVYDSPDDVVTAPAR